MGDFQFTTMFSWKSRITVTLPWFRVSRICCHSARHKTLKAIAAEIYGCLFICNNINCNNCGGWWLSCNFSALHADGCRFKSHSTHVGTLGKSITCSCVSIFLSRDLEPMGSRAEMAAYTEN